MKPKNFSQALDELENLAGPDLRAKLENEIHELQEKLEEMKGRVTEEVHKTKSRVETQARENIWATIGIVGLIFFVVGFIFGWRKSD